jgi:hypothetical protein
MLIVYCEKCGVRVSEEDIAAKRATKVGENQYVCIKCTPRAGSTAQLPTAAATASGTKPAVRAVSRKTSEIGRMPAPAASASRTAAVRSPAAAPPPSPRESKAASAARATGGPAKQKSLTMVVAAGGGVGILLVVLLVAASRGPGDGDDAGAKDETAVAQTTETKSTPQKPADPKTTADKKEDPLPEHRPMGLSFLSGVEPGRATKTEPPKPTDARPTPPPITLTVDEDAWKSAVDLLALFDPAKDAVAGEWSVKPGEGLVCKQGKYARVEFPYEPPAEYDYRIEFTRRSSPTQECVTQIVTKDGRDFAYILAGWGNKYAGFSMIGGKGAKENGSGVQSDAWLEDGKRYTSIVQVRRDGLKAFLNGKLASQWKTDYVDISFHKEWRTRDPKLLGLGTMNSDYVFYRIQVLEVNGKGKTVR